jgi:hypothetical protein
MIARITAAAALAAAGLALSLACGSANAMPAQKMDGVEAPVEQVWGGCGPYGHRGPWGGCRPGGQWGGGYYARPIYRPYYAPRPYYGPRPYYRPRPYYYRHW